MNNVFAFFFFYLLRGCIEMDINFVFQLCIDVLKDNIIFVGAKVTNRCV